jgi:hypothetical protein
LRRAEHEKFVAVRLPQNDFRDLALMAGERPLKRHVDMVAQSRLCWSIEISSRERSIARGLAWHNTRRVAGALTRRAC